MKIGCILRLKFSESQIFDLFDVKHKGFIDFGDFVRALSIFHPNVSQEDKINCKLLAARRTFKIYSCKHLLSIHDFVIRTSV